MDLIITILPVVTKDLPIFPRFTPYNFLSRCKFSTLTTRQPMVDFYLLTFPRFPLQSINTNSCSCLGTSSTTLSRLVQNACLLLAFCVSVGAYATTNVMALARPRSSRVTFYKRSVIKSGGGAARVMEVLTASPTPPCPFFPPF